MKCKIFSLFLFLIFTYSTAQAIPIIVSNSTTSNIELGSSFNVGIDVQDITDLYAFEFDIEYDSAKIFLNTVSEGTFLSDSGTTFFFEGLNDTSSGVLSFASNTLISPIAGASGSGNLINLSFDTLDIGFSDLIISNVIFLDSNLLDISANIESGGFSIISGSTTVPEPSTIVLLALGISGIIWVRRRKYNY